MRGVVRAKPVRRRPAAAVLAGYACGELPQSGRRSFGCVCGRMRAGPSDSVTVLCGQCNWGGNVGKVIVPANADPYLVLALWRSGKHLEPMTAVIGPAFAGTTRHNMPGHHRIP